MKLIYLSPNLKKFTTYLEITFWDLSITLLTRSALIQTLVKCSYRQVYLLRGSKKGYKAAIYLLLFGFCLGVVLWAGAGIGRSKAISSQPKIAPTLAVQFTPANGQRNVLVIGVDRLNARQPRLESTWLVGYFPGRSRLTLVPLYPIAPGSSIPALAALGKSFKLTEDGRPSASTFELLRRQNIWWSSYVMIDEAGMIVIMDFLARRLVNSGSSYDSVLALSAFPYPWEDPAESLQGQTKLLQGLCQMAAFLPSSADTQQILDLIPEHLRTDLDLFQAIQDWQTLGSAEDSLGCDFPLLKVPLP